MRDEVRAREEGREIYTGGGRQRERDECVLDLCHCYLHALSVLC